MTEMNRETMYALLREIRSLAITASMSGALRKGTRVLVEVYNRCLETLAEQGDPLVKSLFTPLSPESTSVDEVGAAAALLSSYVRPAKAERRRHEEDDDDDDDDED